MVIAVIDLDNAYASIEQLFDPALRHVALCVTGPNGGNVIARSQQAKALGIPMGMARHEIQPLVTGGQVVVRAARFATYHALTGRVATLVQTFSPDPIEIYSIDEQFVRLDHVPAARLSAYGQQLRRAILRLAGLAVSIGIAPTKTLAKCALEAAKHSTDRVRVVTAATEITELLTATVVEDLWGIGAQRAALLRGAGVENARQFRDMPSSWVRQRLTVSGLSTQAELRGMPCLPFVTERGPRQQIHTSRAFGRLVTELAELRQAVSTYTSRAAEKLREQGSVCRSVGVSVATNPFREHLPQYSQGVTLRLPTATDYTPDLVAAALAGLERVYRAGYQYHRASVTLNELGPNQPEQGRLFGGRSAASGWRDPR